MLTRLLSSLSLAVIFCTDTSAYASPDGMQFKSSGFTMAINDKGEVTSLKDNRKSKEYLDSAEKSYLLRIKTFGGSPEIPIRAKFVGKGDGAHLTMNFKSGVVANIACAGNDDYMKFTLTGITPHENVEMVYWGPFNSTIRETLGASVGVARNKEFAIGLQGLNVKTTGGIELFSRRRIGNVVTKTRTGSAINAYTRNRTRKRVIESTWNGHHPQTVVEPVERDGDLNHSSIALFGCEPGEALGLIGRLELAERLPHPMHEGKWLKKSPYATSSKIICGINLHDFDETIAMCKKAGITRLYTMGGYKSWGHFEPAMPGGFKQLREMAGKAKAQGITLGAHSLTTFIHPHDPYVTPVPDKRLAVHALTTLSADINETTTEIPIGEKNLEIYRQKQNPSREGLYVIRIGDELIQFGPLSEGKPWRLTKCVRGFADTRVSSHKAGAPIAKLSSHSYKVFLADTRLIPEIARNLAEFFNKSGFGSVGFDGMEGTMACGHAQYSYDLFAKSFYDHVENKGIINSSSDLKHFYWHVATYESWGEPQKIYRQSMIEHRLRSQHLMIADLMPKKMGQFRITTDTKTADIEWSMALGAGYDAGIDFYVSPKIIKKNPEGEQILAAIKKWEAARLSGAFTEEEKGVMRNPKSECHLTQEDGKWKMTYRKWK